jgi:hypothetical protein
VSVGLQPSPCAPRFRSCRALTILKEGYQGRFNIVQEKAREFSTEAGDADLRRLKRQFSSLKNTFLHYVVKDEFIAALADGLPNGTEEIQLASFEEQANRNIDDLRAFKAKNAEVQGEIAALIAQINVMLAETDRINTAATAETARLAEEVAAAEGAAASLPPLSDGLDETACATALAEEAAIARDLETQLAAHMAELAQLESSLPGEREDADVAKAELAELQERQAAIGDNAATGARFAGSAAWSEEASAILQSLGGVSILKALPDAIQLRLHTAYPAAVVAAGSLGDCRTGVHELLVKLDPASGSVAAATLTPADADTADIVEAAGAGRRGVEFVLREVRSRLASVLHRRALAIEAQSRFPGALVEPSGASVTAWVSLRNGQTAQVQAVLEQSWPLGEDVVRVARVEVASSGNGTPECDEIVRRSQGLRLQGRGFVAAFEAVQAQLLGS